MQTLHPLGGGAATVRALPLALHYGMLAVAMPQSGTSGGVLFSRDRIHATTSDNSTSSTSSISNSTASNSTTADATTATATTAAAAFSAGSSFALRATAALAPGDPP